jgi:hypothetical protein
MIDDMTTHVSDGSVAYDPLCCQPPIKMRVGAVTSAGCSERKRLWPVQRDGYPSARGAGQWNGASKFRTAFYAPRCLEPGRMADRAFTALSRKPAYRAPRSVDDTVKTMWEQRAGNQVSWLCQERDGKVQAFIERPGEVTDPHLKAMPPA